MNEQNFVLCNWCGQPTLIIWVHGHGQCSICGTHVDECCRGEEAHFSNPSQEQREKDKSKND